MLYYHMRRLALELSPNQNIQTNSQPGNIINVWDEQVLYAIEVCQFIQFYNIVM